MRRRTSANLNDCFGDTSLKRTMSHRAELSLIEVEIVSAPDHKASDADLRNAAADADDESLERARFSLRYQSEQN